MISERLQTVNPKATILSAGNACEFDDGDKIHLVSINKLAPQTPEHDNRLFITREFNIAFKYL